MALPEDCCFQRVMVPRADEWRAVASEMLTAVAVTAAPYAIATLRPPWSLRRAIAYLTLMRQTNPTPFKTFFILVNTAQILLCARIIFLITNSDFLSEFGFYCQPSNNFPSKESTSVTKACWYYHLANIVATLDTVYLRIYGKKVECLHVYHHSVALVWSWIVAKLVPGGRSFFSVLGISIAHLAIYLYYLNALIGVSFNRRICWNFLTLMQTVLITVGIVHMGMVFLDDCLYPKLVALIYILFSSILLFLFLKLYFKNYRSKIS